MELCLAEPQSSGTPFDATEQSRGESRKSLAYHGLVETRREPGNNTIGMVAWLVRLFTPAYPEEMGGREIVLIANDITHRVCRHQVVSYTAKLTMMQVGSFGVQEDKLFGAASAYARENGLPRIYLAANSGARIGLAEEVSIYPPCM